MVEKVTGSGMINSTDVSGLKYFHRSAGIDPLVWENHRWNFSGLSRIVASIVVPVIWEAMRYLVMM
jgi:hypothetical protein